MNLIFPFFLISPAIPLDNSIRAVEEKKPTALLYNTGVVRGGYYQAPPLYIHHNKPYLELE